MAKSFNTNNVLQQFFSDNKETKSADTELHNLHNSDEGQKFDDIEPKTIEELKAPKKTYKPKAKTERHGNGREKDRTERFNMVMRPSLLEDLKSLAQLEGVSVSTLVHNTLEALTTENAERIKKYNKITKEAK